MKKFIAPGIALLSLAVLVVTKLNAVAVIAVFIGAVFALTHFALLSKVQALFAATLFLPAATAFLSASNFVIALAGFFIAVIVLTLLKIFSKRHVAALLLVFFIFSFSLFFYFSPGVSMARSQGTILSDNWWNALNWIRENTAECATIATYWDPGHFITGIARRSVVFDGASQGAPIVVPTSSTQSGLVTENLDNGAIQIKFYENGTEQRARIKDIALSLFTSNETTAVELLRDYKKKDCDEMYFIASQDLIGKSTWWSYFSTWDPVNKGRSINMQIIEGQAPRPLPSQNAIAYTYPAGQNAFFVLYDINNTMSAFLQQNNQAFRVEKVFYFTQEGGVLKIENDAVVKGMIWVHPTREVIIYIPPEIENSMFTRMFLFNGQGLTRFEPVQNFGGEVKLFRVKF